VVLLEQPQGAQSFMAAGGPRRVCKLAGGLGVLVDCDGGVGSVRRNGRGSRVVVRLDGQRGSGCWLLAAERTLIRGDDSMRPG